MTVEPEAASEREVAPLIDRAVGIGRLSADEILDAFLGWVADSGLEPYAAQEEALLELFAGRHLILNTPTGSGKSLVAQALQFKALCEGRRSFYTAPTKALASEKFFALCRDFGPENVGMLTGDASINAAAPVICCTAEVLANMALRQGEALQAPYVIMDEFHYYGDASRGAAWQVPLLCLPNTIFLLMSATLGDTSEIAKDLKARTSVEVSRVDSDDRPVPLDWDYRETPLTETIDALIGEGKAPIYVVSFTQRDCAELAQGLTSLKISDKDEKKAIQAALADFDFGTAYGKDMRRFLSSGIGIHHAGLLPRYRLLVEQLSQRGLLKVICGTDTLGVGVNIPIRTVLFTRLSKFDGVREGILKVREFKQISGRAGRKGFDDQGSVVCQAPAHVIENKRAKPTSKKKKATAPRGFVAWNDETFRQLIAREPEPLVSRFRLNHGILVNIFRRTEDDADSRAPYRSLIELLERTHEAPTRKRRLRRDAAALFRGLRRAGIVEVVPGAPGECRRVRVSGELQWDFSLHHALSLFLVETIPYVEADAETHALEVVSLVEAVLEDPRAILIAQMNRIKTDMINELKAQRVPYEDRMRLLDEVEPPQPSREFIEQSFDLFAEKHPWVRHEDVRPKSIAREIYEGYYDFEHYVRQYGLQRIEGLLLRYLSQVYSTLEQSVPEAAKTPEIWDALAFLRALLERVDASLLSEWERLMNPENVLVATTGEADAPAYDLAKDAPALRARLRADLHRLTKALADRNYPEALRCIRPEPEDPWDATRFTAALEPFYAEYEKIVFTPRARLAEFTLMREAGPRRWQVTQRLLDPEGDDLWCIEGEVDLSEETALEGPIVRLRRIGT